jgi:precorrin-2 dehydrogenase/sirohydrochlorin ferrochelatase
MDSFPAFLPLAGRRVVVIGTGEAADAKARLFDGSPAIVTRLAVPDADVLAAADLVFIALPDGPELESALTLARPGRALVNVVDRPELSGFTTPSIVDRGAVVAAIGTNGAAPMLATRLRQQLEALVPPRLGDLAAFVRARQTETRRRFPDLVARRRVLRRILDGPVAEAVLAGDPVTAQQAFADILDEESGAVAPAARAGEVWLLEVGPDAGDLTLRDARRLGTADRLWLEGDVPAGVLAFTRRDAARERDPTDQALQSWLASGEIICRLRCVD